MMGGLTDRQVEMRLARLDERIGRMKDLRDAFRREVRGNSEKLADLEKRLARLEKTAAGKGKPF